MLVAHRGESLRVEETTEFFPESELYDSDAPLPGPDAKLAGPTFEEWLKGLAPTRACPSLARAT